MLAELRKHAQTGAALRFAVLNKEAGFLMRAAGRGAARATAWGLSHPVKATTMALGGIAAAGSARRTYNNMRPEVLRSQLGMDR